MNNLMTIVIVASLTVVGASFLVSPSYGQIPGLANLPGLAGVGQSLSGAQSQVGAGLAGIGVVSHEVSQLPSQVGSSLQLESAGRIVREASSQASSITGIPLSNVGQRVFDATEIPVASILFGPTSQVSSTLSGAQNQVGAGLAGLLSPPTTPGGPGSP